jgi:hypothetical protein
MLLCNINDTTIIIILATEAAYAGKLEVATHRIDDVLL